MFYKDPIGGDSVPMHPGRSYKIGHGQSQGRMAVPPYLGKNRAAGPIGMPEPIVTPNMYICVHPGSYPPVSLGGRLYKTGHELSQARTLAAELTWLSEPIATPNM
ncbi:Uncharacterized protein Fot_43189 [Forsythia ovata]|uniref:Uncharacterized protein n=1 Tax=Forsythia ovata TaxID=205694 RepID=A0ABD1RNB8_9LAMI